MTWTIVFLYNALGEITSTNIEELEKMRLVKCYVILLSKNISQGKVAGKDNDVQEGGE